MAIFLKYRWEDSAGIGCKKCSREKIGYRLLSLSVMLTPFLFCRRAKGNKKLV
jgi:hypothetical protein